MSDSIKKYTDLTRLQRYDTKIKDYISGEDAKSYKTILLSTDGKVLNFYKKYNADLTDTADFSIRFGSLISECYVPSVDNDTLVFEVGMIPQAQSNE